MMKKNIRRIIMLVIMIGIMHGAARAQSVADLLQQLALNYQKLAGMKKVLGQMYTSYTVLNNGYNAVKNIAEGNFGLHEVFLNGLLKTSATVRKYPRASDIIRDQLALIQEYKAAYALFRQDKNFTAREMAYLTSVYDHLVARSLENLTDLTIVMTDSKLRMSDGERLAAIDRIYHEGHEQLSFLRKFNDQTYRIALRRSALLDEGRTLKQLYGIEQKK